jgi:hypothetical protein
VKIELDHLFVCTRPNASEAESLIRFGLREGAPNDHPGQGTACRRFSFLNAMIELLWVHQPTDAQNETTAPTRLWQRWSGPRDRFCPFGICVRPVDPHDAMPPFPAWEYRPAYLPAPLSMHIGEAGIEEPMWVYLSFLTRSQRQHWFRDHPVGIREITRLTLHSPAPLRSAAGQVLLEADIIHLASSPNYGLEIEFDHRRTGRQADFSPDLPLVFQF